MATRDKFIRKLMAKKEDSITIDPKGIEHQYPLPIDQLELVDSNDYIGIQIADVIASAANFILTNNNPQYTQFREKLKVIPSLQETDVTLTPSSAAFLRVAMQTPYDGSPVDSLTSFFERQDDDEE